MKKIIALGLCLLTSLSLVACSGSATPKEGDTIALTEMVDKLYEGVAAEETPMGLMTTELTEEMFSNVAFAEYQEGIEAVVSESMVGSIAHSIVIVRAKDEAQAKAIAAEMDENKNPAKWICVEAEKTVVKVNGSTAILVMSSEKMTDTVIANFDALWAK